MRKNRKGWVVSPALRRGDTHFSSPAPVGQNETQFDYRTTIIIFDCTVLSVVSRLM